MRVLHNVMHAVSSVFGCRHERVTRPFTIQSQSYMACLDCGRKLYYSPTEMRRLSRREVRRLHSGQTGIPRIAPAMQADEGESTLAA